LWQHEQVRRATVVLALLLMPLTACRPVVRELAAGPGGTDAPRVFVETLAGRFGPINAEPVYSALRPKLARASFIPSPAFDDTTMWMMQGDDWRTLDLMGYAPGEVYRIGVRRNAPRPSAPGQYWERVRLQRLGDGRYEWTMSEELAVGRARPSDLAAALDALFRGAEHATEASSRAAIAEALPRTSAKLGLLLHIETLALQSDASGATSVRLGVRLTPAGIGGFAPRGAAFIEKYARPMRVSAAVADLQGATWWTLEGADHLWTIRLRVRDGSLVPLSGPADRRLPGRLRVQADVSTRAGGFGLGARRIAAEVTLTRTPEEKSFSALFLQEPDWQLPFLVETLLHSPLRYPFDAPGSQVDWAARDTPRGTLLTGFYRARVRETWILRWLGGMMGNAIGEYRLGAEAEVDRYLRDCLLALRDDLAALTASP
jgi:hypothetical protein